MKYIDIKEFRELGFVQEINRLILHPCGLALEVTEQEDGSMIISGVQDFREDPEGICFSQTPSGEKADKVLELRNSKANAREKHLGYIIQRACYSNSNV